MKLNYIMFDITDKCNFSCKHCYKEQPEKTTDLDIQFVKSFLTDVHNNGFYPRIVISGGEPLMYENIFELLDFICDGREVRINTNGVFLKKFYKKLKNYENLKIQVSLDGYDDATFYEVRNNHLFSKIVDNTVLSFNEGLNIYFRATLTNKTIGNYEKFIELSKKTGVPLVIRPMFNTGEEAQQDLRIEFEDLCNWQTDVIEKKLIEYTGGRDLISENSCPLMKEEIIFSVLTIDNLGKVYPCSLLRSNKFYMGSIYKNSFDEIFINSSKISKELSLIINSDSCKRCGFRNNFGNGTCVPSCYLSNKKCVNKKICEVEEC